MDLLKYLSLKTSNSYLGSIPIKDESYIDYINSQNGGYYFANSMHLYSFFPKKEWNNINIINDIIHGLFKDLVEGMFFFGEDVFGNQFGFLDNDVFFFNIETGEKELIGQGFEQWKNELFQDLNYFTGKNLLDGLSLNYIEDLSIGFRLCPKYPFVLGGEYLLDNLYLKYFRNNFEINSFIANQIYHLKDGQTVKIRVES